MSEACCTARLDRLGSTLNDKVNELFEEARRRHLVIRHQNRVVLDLPLTMAAIGVAIAPRFVALGAVGALVAQCSVEVVRTVEPEPVLDVREPG